MRKRWLVWAGMVFIFVFTFNVHAQETAAPDSIVQLAAQAAGLQEVSSAELPPEGTFWLVMSNGIVPDPAPLFDPSLPIYAITTNGEYLVDETDGQVATEGEQSVADAVAALADEVTNLISQIQNPLVNQTATRGQMAGRMMTMDESGGGFTPALSLDTNGLYLQVSAVSNGLAYLTLNNATDSVYEILSKQDLTATNWTIEPEEVWPTNATAMPFAVQQEGRTNLFVWAMDWTGVTENGNTTPDWWFWLYFQTLDLADGDLDSQGNTLFSDYENGLDPNVITFTLSATNNYVNSMSAPLQVNVTAGVPSYYAVLVDDTNFSDATWNAYTSSNLTANLGSTEGWHQVDVGLRGLPTNAYQTWETTRLKLDLTPPVLVITNPTPGTVTQPVIQLQGYSSEALASISYDLTNATGLITNQQCLILDQFYDTNTLEFTTNYFQCFDVPLTNGLNTVTLHATDWAGNVTTTNFNFTLDYSGKTNPPAIQLYWPQANTKISGNSFTWRGWVSDPTAQVSAQIVNTNGATNSVSGQVGRDGSFWIEGLPLSGGTNSLSLTAMDAAGNTSVTNINVVQSTLVLTITSAGLGQAVSGTISDTNSADYTIWVNSTMATNNGDGTWTAPDPHLTLDTPNVQVRAIPNSDNGGYGDGGGQ